MKQNQDALDMLDLMVRPAFCVRDGNVVRVNHAAQSRLVEVGMPIASLMATGAQEYAELSDGCLFLTLTVSGVSVSASVTRMADADVFLMEEEEDRSELRAMALAAQELRAPLSSVVTTASRLFPVLGIQDNPEAQEQAARINRGLFQIMRLVGNMSDADRYCGSTARMETCEIGSLTEEFFSNLESLREYSNATIQFTGLSDPLYCLVDRERLERAMYNMLSNAMKFTPRGGVIRCSLTRRENRLYFSVWDSGSGIVPELRGSVFSRFRREPAIEDSRYGIGLGMVLIRSTAAAHGGAVLVEQPESGGTRITMTLEIRKNTASTVHSPMLRVDYAGEWDHRLIELSESLPPSLYRWENTN